MMPATRSMSKLPIALVSLFWAKRSARTSYYFRSRPILGIAYPFTGNVRGESKIPLPT
jgi:hypothetical protein